MKDHRRIFVVLAPRPSFRDVVAVFKADDEVVLMSGRRRLEVSRSLKLKAKLPYLGRVGRGAQAGLIVRGTVVDERDGILVHTV